MSEPLNRHHLVWVRDEWSVTHARLGSHAAGDAMVRAWFAAGRPGVVCRPNGDIRPGWIRLGIPLPPSRGKLRIALEVSRHAICAVEPPLLLTEAIGSAPAQWKTPLRQLAEEAAAINLSFRVYGSLAWQHLTGEAYVTDSSDVDLLWQVSHRQALRSALDLLLRWERATGLRPDGELLLRDGGAVAWRELLAPARKVVVKSIASLSLQAPEELIETQLARGEA